MLRRSWSEPSIFGSQAYSTTKRECSASPKSWLIIVTKIFAGHFLSGALTATKWSTVAEQSFYSVITVVRSSWQRCSMPGDVKRSNQPNIGFSLRVKFGRLGSTSSNTKSSWPCSRWHQWGSQSRLSSTSCECALTLSSITNSSKLHSLWIMLLKTIWTWLWQSTKKISMG